MQTFTVPPAVRALLLKVDYLGFDFLSGCANAILIHDDYVERWDLLDGTLTADEIAQIDAWKAVIIA